MKDLTHDSDSENSLGMYISQRDGLQTDTTSSDDLYDMCLPTKPDPDGQVVDNQVGLPFVGSLCYMPFDHNGRNLVTFTMGNKHGFNPKKKRSSRSRYVFYYVYFILN